MRIVRLTFLTTLVVYLPVGFYWYLPYGDEMTMPERQAWFVRGMMSVLVLMLAYQALPGSRWRMPCIGVAVMGLVGMAVALSHPEQPLWDAAAGLLQLSIVMCASLIAFGEPPGRSRRLGYALGAATAFGLLWFVGLRLLFDDPGGPELSFAARVLGTEWAPRIPVGVAGVAAVWAWSDW